MSSVIIPNYTFDLHSYRRMVRWLRYMDKFIKPRLGYDKIIMLDNASDLKFLKKLGCTVHSEDNSCLAIGRDDLFAYRYETHLPRTSMLGYSYFWRFISTIPKLKDTFYQADKYYHIDSDNYIQTTELIDYMKNCNKGFVAFWEPNYNFPTSELFILNKDSISQLSDYGIKRTGQMAEGVLPFTHIEKSFYGGRLPEFNLEGSQAHWLGQVTKHYKVRFRG
jgi:hypothetical protein